MMLLFTALEGDAARLSVPWRRDKNSWSSSAAIISVSRCNGYRYMKKTNSKYKFIYINQNKIPVEQQA